MNTKNLIVYEKEKLIIATFSSLFHVFRSLSHKPYLTEGKLLKSVTSVPASMEELIKAAPILKDFLLRPVRIEFEKQLTVEYTIQSIGELVMSKIPRTNKLMLDPSSASSQRGQSAGSQRGDLEKELLNYHERLLTAENDSAFIPGKAAIGVPAGLHRPASAVTMGNYVFRKKKTPIQAKELSPQERRKIIQGVSDERAAISVQQKLSNSLVRIQDEQQMMVKKMQARQEQEELMKEVRSQTSSSKPALQITLKVAEDPRPRTSIMKEVSGSSKGISVQRQSLDIPNTTIARPGSRRSIFSSRRPEGVTLGAEPAKSIEFVWREHELRVKQNSTALLVDSSRAKSAMDLKDTAKLKRANSPFDLI